MELLSNSLEPYQVILSIVGILLFSIISAFSSMSETLITSININKIKTLTETGNKKQKKQAKQVLKLTHDYTRTLTSILLLNNISNILNTSLATIFFTALFGPTGVVWGILVMTLTIIVFAEIIPKIIAKKYTLFLILKLSKVILFLYYIFFPLTYAVGRIYRSSSFQKATSKDLVEHVKSLEIEGVITKESSLWLNNVIRLSSLKIGEIMTKFDETNYISPNTSHKQLMKIFKKEKHTRYPIVSNDKKKVHGILNIKDYLIEYHANENITPREVMNKPIFVKDSTTINAILDKLQEQRKYFAIVVDMRKQIKGIVTIEDILEEIVGELYDENDKIKNQVHTIGNKSFIVWETTPTRILFKKYLKQIKLPKLTKSTKTFGEWMKNYFDIHEFNIDTNYNYENMSIWIKKDTENNKIMFEIDIT